MMLCVMFTCDDDAVFSAIFRNHPPRGAICESAGCIGAIRIVRSQQSPGTGWGAGNPASAPRAAVRNYRRSIPNPWWPYIGCRCGPWGFPVRVAVHP